MGQERGLRLAGWFWLRDSNEFIIWMSVGLTGAGVSASEEALSRGSGRKPGFLTTYSPYGC